MTSHQQRELDIVVVGATGFTAALTAEYLAGRGPGATRWAVAGRNRRKLEALRERLGVDVPILEADVDDQASLRRVAESALCLANDVLPALAGQAARVADVDRLTLHLKEELRVLTAPCGCGPSRRRERPARRIGWWQQPAWATSSIHRW